MKVLHTTHKMLRPLGNGFFISFEAGNHRDFNARERTGIVRIEQMGKPFLVSHRDVHELADMLEFHLSIARRGVTALH